MELAPRDYNTVRLLADGRAVGAALNVGLNVVLCLGASLALDARNEVQGQSLSVNLILDAVHDLEGEES